MVLLCDQSNMGQVETRCEGLCFSCCFVGKAIWAEWEQDLKGCGFGIVFVSTAIWAKWKQGARGCVLVLLCDQGNMGQVEAGCEGLWFWYCFVSKPIWAK